MCVNGLEVCIVLLPVLSCASLVKRRFLMIAFKVLVFVGAEMSVSDAVS